MKVPRLVQHNLKNKLAFGSVFSRPHLYTNDAKAHVNITSRVKIYPINSAHILKLEFIH